MTPAVPQPAPRAGRALEELTSTRVNGGAAADVHGSGHAAARQAVSQSEDALAEAAVAAVFRNSPPTHSQTSKSRCVSNSQHEGNGLPSLHATSLQCAEASLQHSDTTPEKLATS